jgi:SAM-dependent methyltransferase
LENHILNENTIIQAFILFWFVSLLGFIWVLGFTELSYLGNKGIKFLYNLFSSIYELKWLAKEYSSTELTQQLFLEPLKLALQNSQNAKMLDLACGTGRMSLMVLRQSWFQGSIKAIDFSEGMTRKFRKNIQALEAEKQSRLELQFANLKDWTPSQVAEYDVVSLMEVGEFLPFFVPLVSSISKALKPGALFLLSKPPDWMAWTYFGRCQTTLQLTNLLKEAGFSKILIHKWSSRYEVVQAWKDA